MTWHLPRLQLVGELKEESWGLRGEAPIEILTLSTPVESMPVDPGNIPPGQLKKLVPATTPVSYQSATAEEVAALPGADVFLPALQQLLIDKAILALQPDEPTPPPEENPA
jgi:hypothetical protein